MRIYEAHIYTGDDTVKPKGNKLETALFIFAMITVSGLCFFYNIHSADDLKMTLTLTELATADKAVEGRVISDAAAANINHTDAVEVWIQPKEELRDVHLLPPIVTPDS